MPWTTGLMWIATLAIAGIPPLSAFFSKDEILTAAFARGSTQPGWLVCWALGPVAALLTAFYMTRLMLYTFHGPNRPGENEQAHLAASLARARDRAECRAASGSAPGVGDRMAAGGRGGRRRRHRNRGRLAAAQAGGARPRAQRSGGTRIRAPAARQVVRGRDL